MAQEKPNPLGHVPLRERLHHFTWAYVDGISIPYPAKSQLMYLRWFTLTMSTGGIALLLAVTPHTFRGLITIGTIVFILDLFLFVLISALLLARFILFPGTFVQSVYHPTESLFIPVSIFQ